MPLVALALLLTTALRPGADEQSALLRYRAASKAQEEALADLERAYTHAERALAAFRAEEAGKSPTVAQRLAAVASGLVAQQQERPAPADAKEARARRRADLEELGREGVALATSNGRIVLHLPESVDADVDIRVDNGVIRNDRELCKATGERTGRLRGRLGSGGTPIRLRTSNGSVSLR